MHLKDIDLGYLMNAINNHNSWIFLQASYGLRTLISNVLDKSILIILMMPVACHYYYEV